MSLAGVNLTKIQNKLNVHLIVASDWLKANRLSLNVTKTNYILFTNNIYDMNQLDIRIDDSVSLL